MLARMAEEEDGDALDFFDDGIQDRSHSAGCVFCDVGGCLLHSLTSLTLPGATVKPEVILRKTSPTMTKTAVMP